MVANPWAVSERNPERDDDTGQFSDHYPDEEFLTVVREADLPTTTEVAEAVGCDRRTAYVRLNELEECGTVSSRKIGRTLVWKIADGDTNE